MVPNLWYLWESTNASNRPLLAHPQLKVCTTGSKRFGSPKKVAESLSLWKGCLPTWDEFPQSCYVSDNARSSVYFPNEPISEKFCWKNRLSTTLYVFSSWKREQRQSAAPIYDIQTLRKLFCPAVAKPAPHLLISIPTTVYICLKLSTNGLSIYSHHIWI